MMIVGGVPVENIKEQPWMVLIGPQSNFRNGDVQECSILIQQDYVKGLKSNLAVVGH